MQRSQRTSQFWNPAVYPGIVSTDRQHQRLLILLRSFPWLTIPAPLEYGKASAKKSPTNSVFDTEALSCYFTIAAGPSVVYSFVVTRDRIMCIRLIFAAA